MSEDVSRSDYKSFVEGAPEIYAALAALTKTVDASGLDKGLTELVKVRVSQLNACAFCLKVHLGLARKAGVPQEKLDLLAVWPDSGIYTAREEVALAYAEELTVLDGDAAPDELWEALREEFSQEEAVNLTVTIASINAWNRIGIGLRFTPPV